MFYIQNKVPDLNRVKGTLVAANTVCEAWCEEEACRKLFSSDERLLSFCSKQFAYIAPRLPTMNYIEI